MNLDKIQRRILSNQYMILQKLYPEEAESFGNYRKALEDGYALHYDWMFQDILDELSVDECRWVLNVLQMHRALHNAQKRLGDTAGVSEDDVKFRGFDGNDEDDYFGYAQYFMFDLKRYQELWPKGDFPDINSHHPMRQEYERMLAAWESSEDTVELSREDLLRIVRARRP